LRFTENVVFRVIQLPLLFTLLIIFIVNLPIFNLRLLVQPIDADVQVDNTKTESPTEWIKVSLTPHEITVTDKKRDDNDQPIQRKFKFAFSQTFAAWRNPEQGLYLPLLYDVPIEVLNPISDLEIHKNDQRYDAEFWNNPPKSNLGKDLKRGPQPGVLLVSWQKREDSVRLPYGDYHFVVRRENCNDSEDQPVHVDCDVRIVKFQRALRCP
jgi:hypothetical protein